jgi:hypothetical protein
MAGWWGAEDDLAPEKCGAAGVSTRCHPARTKHPSFAVEVVLSTTPGSNLVHSVTHLYGLR